MTRWYCVQNGGRFLTGFYDGRPDWTVSLAFARRYCQGAADVALRKLRGLGIDAETVPA